MKKFILFASLLLGVLVVQAADFKVSTSGGDVYYNIVDATAKTCEYAPNPDGPYHLTFGSSSVLTATVTNPNDGETYTVIGVGENAFKDGVINSDASGGSVAYNHMWWWPNTITYIKAGAFENTTSNFPCVRFNSGFTPGSVDKKAFINNKVNQFNPAVSGDYYKVTDYNAGNTGDAEGRSGMLYCEENGKKILLVYGGDHHRSSWEKKPDGTSAAANPYYTLTTRVDLSEFNVIGENALYGNQNLQQITFGSGLEAIETDAFKNATAITTIICNAATPPTGAVFDDVVYERILESGNITVPEGSLEAYQADVNWGRFWAAAPPASERVHIVEAEHGAVEADNLNPADGATVTLTVTPEIGYKLENIKAEAVIGSGNAQAPRRIDGPNVGIPVELTTVTEGETYTFVMPDAPYEVKVTSEFALAEYDITITEGIENGTVTADKETAGYGETVTVTATPAEGYQLTSLTYTVEGEEPVAIENGTFNMPAADVTINATFTAIDYTITIAEGITNGTMASDKETANVGETVTLTVTPAEGYELDQLTVMNGENPVETALNTETGKYIFEMPAANVTVTATFKAINYTITVADGIENGTVTAPATANYGDAVNVTVTPAEGYELATLTYTVEGAEPVAIENGTFNMPASNVTINATFTAVDYTITVAEGIENGTVVADKETANVGETVTLTVTPAEGYQLESITVNGVNTDVVAPVNENNEFTMPADDVIINATFTAIDYTITVAEGIEHGTVTAPEGANYGDVVNVTVTTDTGYELETLTYTVEGEEPVAIENNTFNMPAANVTINATFTLVDYTITVDDEIENGTVTAPETANYGETVTLTVTPAEGYQLKSITVTGVNTDVVAPVNENNEFTMPADDVIVTAEFEEIPPVESTITIAETENGTVAVYVGENQIESGAVVAEGTTVKVVLTPNAGYVVESYSVETTASQAGSGAPRLASVPVTDGDEENSFTFEMPGEPVTVTASFVEDVVTAVRDLRAAGYNGVIYVDVNGRVSSTPFKGVNIVINGNKVTKMVK